MNCIRTIAAFVCAALLLSGPVAAKEKSLGSFGAWNAYASNDGGQTVCYMVTSKTVKSIGPKRAPPYLMITHRPVEASTDTISYGAGTALDSKRGVTLTVDKAAFGLFSVRDTGWARDGVTDHRIAAALRAAPMAQAKAVPAKKGATPILDQFDLAGGAGAYHAIGKACGLINDKPHKPVAKSAAKKSMVAKKPVKKKSVKKKPGKTAPVTKHVLPKS